jgi:hypothetical protein
MAYNNASRLETTIPGTMPSVRGAAGEVRIFTLWTFTLLDKKKTQQ